MMGMCTMVEPRTWPRLSNCLVLVQICCTPRSNSGFYNISCDDDACLLCLELRLMAA